MDRLGNRGGPSPLREAPSRCAVPPGLPAAALLRGPYLQGGKSLDGQRDIAWLTPDGEEMTDSDWNIGYARAVIRLPQRRRTSPSRTRRGQKVRDDSFLLLLNAHSEPVGFTIAEALPATWRTEIDTGRPDDPPAELRAGEELTVEPRSLVVLRAGV